MTVNWELVLSICSILTSIGIALWIAYNEKQRDKERKIDQQKEFVLNFYQTEIKPILDQYDSIEFDRSIHTDKELTNTIQALYYNLTCLQLSSKGMFFFDKISMLINLFDPFVHKYGEPDDNFSEFEKLKKSHLTGDLLQVSKLLYGMMTIDQVYFMIFEDVSKNLHASIDDIIQ